MPFCETRLQCLLAEAHALFGPGFCWFHLSHMPEWHLHTWEILGGTSEGSCLLSNPVGTLARSLLGLWLFRRGWSTPAQIVLVWS